MANKNFQVGFVFGAKKAGTFDKTFKSIGSSIKGVAKGIAGIAGAYVGFSAIKGAIDTFATFEQSMANVKAVSGATAIEFKALEDAAMEMGRKTSKTAAESADALGYMALAGWDTQQSIKGLEPILRSSEAFTMDLATASDLVTDSMSAMGISVDDLGGYLDTVAKAQSSANANGQQMLEAYMGVGGKLKDMNANMTESASILGIMANRGIKGSEAGNSLNTILMRMTASSGDSAKAMQALNVSAFDAQGNWRSVEDIFKDVETSISDMSEKQQAYYKDMIAGKNHSATFSAIMSGLGEEYDDLKVKITDCDGALLQTADTMNDTMQGAFKRLESATDDMKIQFVKTFEKGLTGSINKAAEHIPVLTEKVTQGIQWIAAKVAPAFASIKENAVAAIKFAKQKWDQYGPGFIAIGKRIKDNVVSAFLWIKDTGQAAFEKIWPKIEATIPKVQELATSVMDVGGKIWSEIQPAVEWVFATGFPAIFDAGGKILGVAQDIFAFISTNWEVIAPLVMGIVGAFAAYKGIMLISKGVTIAVTAVQWALNAAMTANPIGLIVLAIGALIGIGILLYKNWDKIKAKAGEVWQGIKGAFGSAVGWFKGIWDGIKAPFVSAGKWFHTAVVTPIIKVFSPIVQAIRSIFAKIWEIITVLFSVAASWFKQNVIEPVKTVFFSIVETVGGVFQSVWTRITEVFSAISTWFSERFTEAWQSIQEAFAPVGDFFSGIWITIKETFSSIGTAIGDAIGGAFKAVVNAVIGFASDKINGFISAINFAVGIINKIPGVNIEPLQLMNIPMLAKGGIATSPTLAMVGEGKESEAILPLSKLNSMMNAPIGAITSMLQKFLSAVDGGGAGGGTVFKFSPQLVFNAPASKEDVVSAIDEAYLLFKKFTAQHEREVLRKSLKPRR